MTSKRTVRTKHSDIFDYYKDKCITDDGEIEVEIGYDGYNESKVNSRNSIPIIEDWGEPCCFACGRWTGVEVETPNDDLIQLWNQSAVKSSLERAHIVPHALGGKDEPQNLFCLCKRCHHDSPDTIYPKEFFRWCYKRRKEGGLFTRVLSQAYEICTQRNINPSFIFASDAFSENLSKLSSHGGTVVESSYVAALVGGAEKRQEAINNLIVAFTDGEPCAKQITNVINSLNDIKYNRPIATIKVD